jgi:hypothetical protein
MSGGYPPMKELASTTAGIELGNDKSTRYTMVSLFVKE